MRVVWRALRRPHGTAGAHGAAHSGERELPRSAVHPMNSENTPSDSCFW